MIPTGYKRVTRSRVCPVCGHPDWCLIAHDLSKAICPRIVSATPAGDAGFVHVIDPNATPLDASKVSVRSQRPYFNGVYIHRQCRESLGDRAAALAEKLGVSVASLDALGLGYCDREKAYSFPMRDGLGSIVGIRLRNDEGKKWAIRNGKQGLFYNASVPRRDTVFVFEGPTDTAAGLDWGFNSIGRASALGNHNEVRAVVGSRRVVIVADGRDENGIGLRGANVLALDIARTAEEVRVIVPPAKDARAWKNDGASAKDVLKLMAEARPVEKHR